MQLNANCLTSRAGFFIPDYTAYNEMLGLFKNVGDLSPPVSACDSYALLSSTFKKGGRPQSWWSMPTAIASHYLVYVDLTRWPFSHSLLQFHPHFPKPMAITSTQKKLPMKSHEEPP